MAGIGRPCAWCGQEEVVARVREDDLGWALRSMAEQIGTAGRRDSGKRGKRWDLSVNLKFNNQCEMDTEKFPFE